MEGVAEGVVQGVLQGVVEGAVEGGRTSSISWYAYVPDFFPSVIPTARVASPFLIEGFGLSMSSSQLSHPSFPE